MDDNQPPEGGMTMTTSIKEQHEQLAEITSTMPAETARTALAYAVMSLYLAANQKAPLPPADIDPVSSLLGLVMATELRAKAPAPIDTKGKSADEVLTLLTDTVKHRMITMMVTVMADVSSGKRPVPKQSDPSDIFIEFVKAAVEADGGIVIEIPPDAKFDPSSFDPGASAGMVRDAIRKAKGE
jgi:hypothetical protein